MKFLDPVFIMIEWATSSPAQGAAKLGLSGLFWGVSVPGDAEGAALCGTPRSDPFLTDSWKLCFAVFHDHTFQEGFKLGLVSTLPLKVFMLADLLKTLASSNVSESYLNKGVDKTSSSLLQTPEPGEHSWCARDLQFSFQPDQHPQLVAGKEANASQDMDSLV